ncbi:MAG TPA: hypothetical protein VMQ54_11275 [Steroidobacteraceae bacterium]|nr:hypothetical protein [Steroidobacteraceae bacterium]
MNVLSAAEREASFWLRRAAMLKKEAAIYRAQGDDMIAAIFESAVTGAEKMATELRNASKETRR